MPYDFGEEADLTDDQLSDAIAKLGPLSRAEIEKILPPELDAAVFNDLLAVVNSAASQNEKVAKLRERATDLGSAAIKLAKLAVI